MARPPAPPVKAAPTGVSPMLIGGVVILIVALIGVLVWAATRSDAELEASGGAQSLPRGEGISVGPGIDEDVLQVRIFQDFQCPFCAYLELEIGDELGQMAQDGEANVTFSIMSFLDERRGNDSSSRAANGAVCAADADIFLPWHLSVFENLPEGNEGWTDEQFVGWARDAGLEGEDLDEFGTCVAEQTYADYVADMQARANQDGVRGTPTVVVNDQTLTDEDLDLLLRDGSALRGVLDNYH